MVRTAHYHENDALIYKGPPLQTLNTEVPLQAVGILPVGVVICGRLGFGTR